MSIRATCWSVTINNPTQSDEYNIGQVRQKGWQVVGQLEKGENGTPHYQLLVRTPQVRFSQVKKAFPRAHIEVARNQTALSAYVQKEETRVGQIQLDQSKYPTQLQLFDWFASFYDIAQENKIKECAGDMRKLERMRIDSLAVFDEMVHKKIREGFMIGAEIMNPQIRAFIKRFGFSIYVRHKNFVDRQTDRQSNLFSQQVTIPQNANEKENASLQEETSDPPSSDDEREEKTSKIWRVKVYQGDD